MKPSEPGILDKESPLPNERRRTRERRIWARALVLSALAHALVFLLLSVSEHDPLEDPGAAGADTQDEEPLDGGLQTVSLSEAPEEVTYPDGIPVPVPDLPEPPDLDPEPQVEPTELADGFDGLWDRPGDDVGDADAGADGDGSGAGGSGGGGLERTVPPSPRGLIVPPSNPDLDGATVRVRVFVTEAGEVVPDSTILVPPTQDDGFNDRLRDEAASWQFEPARRHGEPVAEWFTYEVSM